MELIPLVRQAMAEDSDAFRELVIRSQGLVRAICVARSGDHADADDLVQEVFLRVYRDLPSLRNADRYLPWLRQVATNVCRMWLRRESKAPTPLDMAPEPEDPSAQDRLRRCEVSQLVREVLGQISQRSREVLALRYLADCSEAEISDILSLPPSTVKSRLHEGRKQAKRFLHPMVKEFLQSETRSEEIVTRVMQRCGSPGCICPDTLTEGR